MCACLHGRDNPNDPGADNNLVEGEPVFSVRYNSNDIELEDEINIGTTTLGNSSDSIFYIENKGSAYLHLTGIEITSSTAYTALQGPVTPVKPGDSTSIIVRFTPEETGSYAVTLYIHYWDNNEERVFSFDLTGTGV